MRRHVLHARAMNFADGGGKGGWGGEETENRKEGERRTNPLRAVGGIRRAAFTWGSPINGCEALALGDRKDAPLDQIIFTYR